MTYTNQSLGDLRAKIAALQAEHAALTSPHRGRKAVLAMVSRYLEQTEAAGRTALVTALQRADVGQALAPFTVKGSAAVSAAPGAAPFALDMSGLVVALLGAERIKALLTELCDEIPEAPDAKQRDVRLRKVEADLYALELEEEALVCRLEDEGVNVTRRPDARPEIVLARAV